MQVTFTQKNNSSALLNLPVKQSNYYKEARLYSISIPQFDTISSAFNNNTIITSGGTYTVPDGLYRSVYDLADAITTVTSSAFSVDVSEGSHVYIKTTIAGITITPNFLTQMLGFDDSQFTAPLIVAPDITLAANLPTIIPIHSILIESNNIISNQYIQSADGTKLRGFYIMPFNIWDLSIGDIGIVLNSTDLNAGITTNLAAATNWRFTFFAHMINGEIISIQFPPQQDPTISIIFK